jgi:hypothetical protein
MRPEAAVVLDDLWVPLPPGPHSRPLSELESQINAVQARVTRQSDYFSMLDLAVTERAASVRAATDSNADRVLSLSKLVLWVATQPV